MWSVVCELSSVLHYLPFAVCDLLPPVGRLLSVVYRILLSAVGALSLVCCGLVFAVCMSYVACSPQSSVICISDVACRLLNSGLLYMVCRVWSFGYGLLFGFRSRSSVTQVHLFIVCCALSVYSGLSYVACQL